MPELTYKYRLYPTASQQKAITQVNNTVRLLYNRMLKDRTEHYRKTGKWKRLNASDIARSSNLFSDLDETVINWTERALERAYIHFFWATKTQKDRWRKEALLLAAKDSNYRLKDSDLVGYPKYKNSNPRENWTVGGDKLSFEGKRVNIPGVGRVKIVLHRPLPDEATLISGTVIKKPSGDYYLLCRISLPETKQKRPMENAIGVALEAGCLAVRSDDVPVNFVRQDDALTKRIETAYQTLRRRTPGSRRYEKQRKYLAKLTEKRVNQRWDSLHKISRDIVSAADAVYVDRPEILKRKRKLSKSGDLDTVLDEAWWRFTSYLEYKAENEEKKFWRVPRVYPAYRICSSCSSFGNDSGKDGMFICSKCGLNTRRTVNAAKVFQQLGEKYIREWNGLSECN